MKRKVSLLAVIALLGLSLMADVIPAPPTPPPSAPPPTMATTVSTNIPPEVPNLFDWLTTGTNYFVIPFMTYSVNDHTVGGGVALGYRMTEVVAPVLRMDYFDNRFYSVSLTANLQMPRSLMGKIPTVPFALAGGGMPFAGAGEENGTFITIVGAGFYVPLSTIGNTWWLKNSSVVVDYEKWFGMPENQTDQVRVGWSLRF